MATSLAAQLQKLAAPQTSLLYRDKKRASLLFDPKEAATIGRDTFYEIGISGLRELQVLNEDFVVFEDNLFSHTSKNFERAVQNKHTNAKLDKNIKKFLMILSPYFLLKSAHKALEWLIHRFSIHEHNCEDFLKLIFPYHETNVFVRCLQLFNFHNPNNNWSWLRPTQKSGVHLNKLTLYNHAVSDIGFMKFLSKMIFDAVYENQTKANSLTTLFAFYCTTTIGVIERSQEITEPQLSAILPPLLKGLSSNIPDYIASTYMITAQLLTKTKLSHKLLNSVVQRITAENQKNLRTEATLLLVVLYQSQSDHFKSINSTAMQSIAKYNWFAINVGLLATTGSHVLPLLVPVIQYALAKIKYLLYEDFIELIFREVRLNDEGTNVLLRIVLDNCPSNDNDDNDTDEVESNSEMESSLPTSNKMEWYSTFLKKLETQYPTIFDRILTEILSNQSNVSDKRRQALHEIMNFMMSCDRDKNTQTIFQKLHHPNADNRLSAIQFLVKNFTKLTVKDREMFEGAINILSLDDNVRIVTTILAMPKYQLLNIVGENNFVEIAIKVLIKCYKSGSSWNSVVQLLLLAICAEERIIKNSKLLLVFLPFLIPSNEQELDLALTILNSKFASNYTFLIKTRKNIKNIMSPIKFANNIYENIIAYNDIKNVDFENNFKNLPEKLEIHKFLFVLLIATNLKYNKSDLNINYIKNIIQFLPSAKLIMKKKLNEITYFNSALRKNIPPLQGYLKCLQIVIENINMQNLQNQFFDFLNPNKNIQILTTILSILLKGCQSEKNEISSCYSKLTEVFFKKFFSDFEDKINFLVNFITLDDSLSFKIDAKTHIRIILIIYSLLKQSKDSISWIVELKTNIFVPSLLIGLINPLKEIREALLFILELMVNCTSTLDKTYKHLLQEIFSYKEEIILDATQLPIIIGTVFSMKNNKLEHYLEVFYNIICDIKTPTHISSSLLKVFSFVNSEEILEQISKYAVNILKETNNENILLDTHRSSIISNVIHRLNETTCKYIKVKSSAWEFLNIALRHDIISLNQTNAKIICPAVLTLNQITRTVFANVNQNVQTDLIRTFIQIVSSSGNPEVVQNIYKTVKLFDLDAKLLIEYLNGMKDLKSTKILPQRKFRRVSEIPTVDVLDMIEWKYGITALEFIQDKKKLSNSNILLPYLFGILKKCLDFEEQGAVEYPKQIILTAILHVCNKMETEGLKLPKNACNMELIVQCVRASQNPQTHHHALLVLAHAATLIPDQVLHNIMAIFTFMGSSVLRQDDSYSFQIISKIIDTIIPLLVKNFSDQKEKNVASVLRVFVDVILDVPEHRRMPLFQKLIVTLGTENYLWLFLVLVLEAHVLHKNEDVKQVSKSHNTVNDKPKRLDIATNIALQFSPPLILKTAIKLLEHVKSLPVDKPDSLMDTDCVTFNIQQHSAKQFRHYKYTIVTFLSGLLSSKYLVNLFAQLSNDDLLTLEPIYKNLIIHILTYIQTVSKTVDKMSTTPQAQYWKIMIHHCYDTMDSINALLTTEMFLLVIRGLIAHNIPTVRRKAMEILNTKLQYQPSFFYSNLDDVEITNPEDLLALIPSLINIIKTSNQDGSIEMEQELIQQTAFLSLKLLIKLLASKYPDKFTPILDFVIDLIKKKNMPGNILSSVMLCLAELCTKLRAYSIRGIPKFMPAIIKILKVQQSQEVPGLLLLCIITAIQKIIESLPLFLSPYLEKLLTELTILSAKWDGQRNESKVEQFIKKLDSIRSNIGTVIPSRILIPTITRSYCTLLENKQYAAIGSLMNVLSENLSTLRGNELNEHLSELTNFFVSSLQFRLDHKSEIDIDTIATVEDHIIRTVTTLVLKLSETTFRPFYYKLFDWATRGDLKTEKVITFYRLSHGIAENLKGLFVLFAGHCIKNASELLDATNSIKNENNLYFDTDENNILLIESIINTLRAVFMYDSKNFLDRDRFDTLMQSLVDQLENETGGIKSLMKRTDDLIIPCIAQFAVASADDALWKQLNYQILLKTRHSHSQIRLIGLKCLLEIARKVREDFLPLLPETIPFLAELLEDEDETVEKSCRKAVQDLEIILGEPLEKYF